MEYIFGIVVENYIITAIAFIILSVAGFVFRRFILTYLDKLADNTNALFDDIVLNAVHRINNWFYYLIALYISIIFFLDVPKESTFFEILSGIVFVLIVYQIVVAINSTFDFLVEELQGRPNKSSALATGAATISTVLKGIVWVLGLLILLSNFGVEVGALLAGLGIGGLAIAFASQKILADIFSAFVIFIDRPLSVGDFVTIGSTSGTVERIGLKTTKIRATTGEEIIISNEEVASSRIENTRSRKERRYSFTIHLDYNNSKDKIERATSLIKDAIKNTKQARFLRSYLDRFEDTGIAIEYVFYVEIDSLEESLSKVEEVQLKIFEAFKKNKIEFSDPLKR